MACERFSSGNITVFVCGRTQSSERCRCGRSSVSSCSFALGGAKTGQVCGKHLCQWCATKRGDTILCQAHGRIK